MAASNEQLLLIDAEDNKEYKVIVSAEDAERARRGINAINIIMNNFNIFINMETLLLFIFIDVTFATLLLEEAKRNIVQSYNLPCNISLTNERKYHNKCY